MKRDDLSSAQWGALLWAAALAPATELLPGGSLALAGRGAWLSPLAAAVVLLPLLARGGNGLGLQNSRGGKLLLWGCALWMELLLALRLSLCARRMLWSGERDGAVWYFLLPLTALALWMVQGKLTAFGRAGQLYLLLLLGAAGLILGLSVTKVRPDRVLPLWTEDALPVLLSALPTAGGLGWAVLPMLLLPGEGRKGRPVLLWGLGGCALLSLAQLVILGNLGVGLAGQSDSAFFALTKSVGVEGAFRRVESVVSAAWMLSDLTLCVVLARAIGLAAAGTIPYIRWEGASSVALLTAAAVGLWLCRVGAPVEHWNREWVWLGNLAACFAAAGGLCLVKKTKKG